MLRKLFLHPIALLAGVVFFSLAIRLYNINYNSPFLDEAIYIMLGKKIFLGTIMDEGPFSWVGGMPFFYPLLSSIAYNFGGIIGSRVFNVFLGIVSTVLVYFFVKNFQIFEKEQQNKISGIIAAFFFAIAPVPLWLSRLAIYDMLSFTFFLGGVVLLQTGYSTSKRSFYIFSALFLFLSFLAKYTALMAFPFLVGILLIYVFIDKKNQLMNTVYFLTTLLLTFGIYILTFFPDLREFLTGQVVNAGEPTTLEIVTEYFFYTGIWYVLALIGAFLLIRKNKHFFSYLILVVISFVPLLLNLLTKNDTTIHQNSLYTLLLLLPFCSSLLTILINIHKLAGIAVLFLLSIPLFYYSQSAVWTLEHDWENSDKTVAFVSQNITSEDTLLSELGDVAFLPISNKVPSENLYGPFVFDYQNLEGDDAYLKAIQDKYFSLIQLDGSVLEVSPELELALQNNYDVAFEDGQYVVYSRKNDE